MKRKFFAAFLSLCMVMSLLPMTVLAADDTNTPSTQVATELPAADENGVITLTKDVTLSSRYAIKDNAKITIDLAGFTVSNAEGLGSEKDEVLIDVQSGSLTIKDSSEEQKGKIVSNELYKNSGNSGNKLKCVQVYAGATFTLERGTVENSNTASEASSVINNYGTVNIEGGTVKGVSCISNFASVLGNNSWDGKKATCNINGGLIEGTECKSYINNKGTWTAVDEGKGWSWGVALFGPGFGEDGTDEVSYDEVTLNMNGGTIQAGQGIGTNASSGRYAGNTITINGGTIEGMGDGGAAMYLPAIGKTTINGGTIKGEQGIRICAGELTINGGTVNGTAALSPDADLVSGGSGGTEGAIVIGKAGTGYVGNIVVNISENATVQNTATDGDVKPAIVVSDKNMALDNEQKINDPSGKATEATFDYSESGITVNVESQNIKGDVVKVSNNTADKQTRDGGNTSLTLTNANITGNVINQTKEGDVGISGSTITGNVTNASKGEVVISNNSKIDGTVSNTGTSGDDEKGYVAILDSTVTGAINNAAENNITIVNSTVNNVPTTNTEGKVAMIGAKTYDTLEKAIEAAQDGGTVVLLANITNENVGTIDDDADTVLTIDKSITIQGNGNEISIDLSIPDIFEDRDQIFSIGETKESTVAVTLDGVTMNIKGNNTGKGDAFDVWGTLNITNGSNITVKNAQSAFTMQGGENAKVNIDKASTVTANNIHGNFSNGGIWTIKEGSSLDINTAGNHGLSVEELTVDASTVSVDGAAYTGILAATVTLKNDANVTVTNCGKDLPQKSQWAPDKESYKNAMELKGETPTLTVDNSTLTLTNNVNKDGTAINSIYLGKGTLTQQNNPTINVDKIVTSDEATTQYYVVTYMSNGEKWDSEVVNTGSVTLPEIPDQGYNHFQGWTDQAGNRYDGGQTVKIEKDTTFTAVWSYTPPANPNYKITIGDMENGTVTANPTAAKAGATVTLTPVPDEGYALSTLTVTDRFGDAVRVTENSDGTYTFTMPNGQVTVTATFVETEAPVDEPFVDVAEGDWFYDAVVYAYQNELMDGVGGSRFAPNSETTRAQLVTILYRLEGEPAVSGDLPFTDVESGTWYTDAILWAAQNNIVNGVSDTEFAPGDDLTRQQLVTILYRYAEAKGYDVSASADLSGYPDADQVQDYAQPAMAWAVAENIIQGMEDGTLKPAGNASRAQIATILMRFCEDVAQ